MTDQLDNRAQMSDNNHETHQIRASDPEHEGHGEHSGHTRHELGPHSVDHAPDGTSPSSMSHMGHMSGMNPSVTDHTSGMVGMDHMSGMASMGHSGHDGHSGHVEKFRRLFWIDLILAVPVVAFSPMFASLIGYSLPSWTIYIAAFFGTVMYFWGGWPFLTGAVSEIRDRRPGMMTLVSLAITVAFASSWAATLGLAGHELEFWWELALLIVIMLLGHWIEMRSLAQTTSALGSLAALLPDEAEVVEGNTTVKVSPSELKVGDIVVVRPGGSIPADGRIVDGRADIDESMVTGESKPVSRGVGDKVVAGTVAVDSGLRVEVTAVGDDTTLAGIQKLVDAAQNSTTKTQLLADRAANLLFWYALAAAIITAVVWTLLGRPDDAVVRAITVLVIACPHALGLAIPLVVSIATERAAKAGVLIKDREALESMRNVDVVMFDKTGTLTKGAPAVTSVEATGGMSDSEVLHLAASAEVGSEHPLAKAIVHDAKQKGLELAAATNFVSSPAVGVSAEVNGSRIQVGGPRMLEQIHGSEVDQADAWRAQGATILHVVRDGKVIGGIALSDEIRPESLEAVEALKKLDIEVVMITGDAEAVAVSVAKNLGISRVFSGVKPEEKASKVATLQGEGKIVAMVGDGVNDAPALAQADVGLAIGAGTDVAIASADVVLASSDPRSVLSVIELSRATVRKMKQNLWWAAGYNLISVPLAAGVLAPVGFVLPMSVGAILMSASTVVVALNAQLLRKLNLDPAVVVGKILAD